MRYTLQQLLTRSIGVRLRQARLGQQTRHIDSDGPPGGGQGGTATRGCFGPASCAALAPQHKQLLPAAARPPPPRSSRHRRPGACPLLHCALRDRLHGPFFQGEPAERRREAEMLRPTGAGPGGRGPAATPGTSTGARVCQAGPKPVACLARRLQPRQLEGDGPRCGRMRPPPGGVCGKEAGLGRHRCGVPGMCGRRLLTPQLCDGAGELPSVGA